MIELLVRLYQVLFLKDRKKLCEFLPTSDTGDAAVRLVGSSMDLQGQLGDKMPLLDAVFKQLGVLLEQPGAEAPSSDRASSIVGSDAEGEATGYLRLLREIMGEDNGQKAWVMMRIAAGLATNGFRVDKETVQSIVELEQRFAEDGAPAADGDFCAEQAKKMIFGIMTMCGNDASLRDLQEVACACGNFNEDVIMFLETCLALHEQMHELLPEAATDDADDDQKRLYDIFEKFDDDKSGSIDFDEYVEVMKFLNINIPRYKAIEIFALNDRNRDFLLDFDEFQCAIRALQEQLTYATLQTMGLSMKTIIGTVLFGFTVLTGLLGFILVGIAAFTSGSTFGAVVNSALAGAGGLGVNTVDGDGEEIDATDHDQLEEVLLGKLDGVLSDMDPDSVD